MGPQHYGCAVHIISQDTLADLVVLPVGLHDTVLVRQAQTTHDPNMIVNVAQVLHQNRVATELGQPDMEQFLCVLLPPSIPP